MKPAAGSTATLMIFSGALAGTSWQSRLARLRLKRPFENRNGEQVTTHRLGANLDPTGVERSADVIHKTGEPRSAGAKLTAVVDGRAGSGGRHVQEFAGRRPGRGRGYRGR